MIHIKVFDQSKNYLFFMNSTFVPEVGEEIEYERYNTLIVSKREYGVDNDYNLTVNLIVHDQVGNSTIHQVTY